MGVGTTNPESFVVPRRPVRVRSSQRDCVVHPHNSQVCSGPRPLGRSGAEKGVVLSGGMGDGREDRCGSGRFQTSISCAAQFSLQNRGAEQSVTPSWLSWWLALATLQMYGVSCPQRRALSPGFHDSCMRRRHPLPRNKTE